MQGQGSEDLPTKLARVWKSYRVPIILGLASILFIIVSITILIKSVTTSTPITFSSESEATIAGAMRGSELVVDIAGAVVKPGIYRLDEGSRVEEAIVAAGGLSVDADSDRLAKVVNRAAKLSDGAKLYIPKKGDSQTSHIISASDFPNSPDYPNLVSINAASQSDLEALTGIGPATATKIIHGRPYTGLEELVAKKAMGQALFDKLKAQLTL